MVMTLMFLQEMRIQKKDEVDRLRKRINASPIPARMKAQMLKDADNILELEMQLLDSRLEVTLDFEAVHNMPKSERKTQMDYRRRKRAEQKEANTKRRNRLTVLHRDIDRALETALRGVEL
jgi:hypothetical protein